MRAMRMNTIERALVMGTAGVLVALCAAGCTGASTGGSAGGTTSTASGEPSTAQSGGSSASGGQTPPTGQAVQPGPTDDPATASSSDCKAAELRLSIGRGSAAAGTTYRPLQFTNTGQRNCTIQGFPGVSYVAGDDGHQVGPAAYRDGVKGASITLAPGEVASATVGFVQVLNYDPAVCRPTAVRGLRVYPPHDTAAMFLPMDGTGCAGSPPGNQLTVRTVQRGLGES